jgi:hypothetical protein
MDLWNYPKDMLYAGCLDLCPAAGQTSWVKSRGPHAAAARERSASVPRIQDENFVERG